MPLAGLKEDAGGQQDQYQIDYPKPPGAHPKSGDIQEIDQWWFMIEKVAVGHAAFRHDPASIAEHFFVIEGDIDRRTIQQGQQYARCQEEEKGAIGSVHHRSRNSRVWNADWIAPRRI